MSMVENNIVQLLTGKPNLKDVEVDELQSIVNEHPYFSVAQLLLTKKMKLVNHPGFEAQLQIAALHFPNEHWLHYQFLKDEESGESAATIETSTAKEIKETEVTAEPFLPPKSIQNTGNNNAETTATEPVFAHTEDKGVADEFLTAYETPVTTENETELNELITESETKTVTISEPESEELNEVSEPVPAIEEQKVVTESGQPASTEDAADPKENVPESAQIFLVNHDVDDPEELPLTEEEQQELPQGIDNEDSKLTGMLQQQAEDYNKPVEDARLPIETEPYHTVDYFASQGIKLLAEQQQDQLTKKVHKFTDWLKQMKRISPRPTDLGSDPEMESFVQNIADTSNQTKDVVTEAMAEVLVKQGKNIKAVEVYEKLSLLNPVKSAYFAAKIEQLKD